ncbi:hypothetical protein [Vibrio intestinalis]|uniref:hypothetical protein n=1 Tax=Vibrio intestinalis TaxID=2933291 RepID=UPI0021A56042|nr:hypothetical protein [Vibrio intestinalis]
MKKISLLAASVAIALTGCGGSDGGSDDNGTSPSGSMITAFDGYFKNAVVFIDKNNNGVWDHNSGDVLIGLTDAKGQVPLSNVTIEDGQSIAVQTVVPGFVPSSGLSAQDKLIEIDAQKYAGIYTVDMDLPGQAMEHEVVFRAPKSSDVISPITDLVAIEMGKGATEAEAITSVETSLGVTELDPYSDFVADADNGDNDAAVLHKTAQILTATKADTNVDYENKATDVAKDAKELADSIAADDSLDINDPSLVVPVDGVPADQGGTPEVPTYKTVVNHKVYETVEKSFDDLDLELGDNGSSDYLINALDISKLFENAGQGIVINPDNFFISNASTSALTGSNIDVGLGNPDGDKSKLYLGVSPSKKIEKAGEFDITIELRESSDVNSKLVVSARFELEVDKGQATAPEVTDVLEQIEDTIEQWELVEGQAVDTNNPIYTVSYSGLFNSDNELDIYVKTNLHSNALELHQNPGNETIELFGTPKLSSEDTGLDYKIWFTARDKETGLEQVVTLDVPAIAEEPEPEPNPLEGKTWYLLEHGSDDGDDTDGKDYSRVWCDSIKLEDGIVYFNERSQDNRTQCSEPTTQVDQSTYVINDNGDAEITFKWTPKGESQELSETHTITIADDSDDIAKGALTIVTSYDSVEDDSNQIFSERYVYFTDKADAEARLNVKSDDDGYGRGFTYHFPGEEVNMWNLGQVSIALSNERDFDGEDINTSDADISFDDPNQDIKCEYLSEFFHSFAITGDDIGVVRSTPFGGHNFECSNSEENGVWYSNIDFDIPQKLTVGNVYSVIGYVKTAENSSKDQGEYIESVKFNIEWTGTANED